MSIFFTLAFTHLVECLPQADDSIALPPAALLFIFHHAVAGAADGLEDALGFEVHLVHECTVVMHGLHAAFCAEQVGGAVTGISGSNEVAGKFRLHPHKQAIQTVSDAVLVVVDASAAVISNVFGFVLAVPAVHSAECGDFDHSLVFTREADSS